MKNFLAVIKIQGLSGTAYYQKIISAGTLRAAKSRAYASIGDQTGDVVLIGEQAAAGIQDAANLIIKGGEL